MDLNLFIWLFPSIFMLHELEEIVMLHPWLSRNGPRLRKQYPKMEPFLAKHSSLSTSAFSLIVTVEFIFVLLINYYCSETHSYSTWFGVLLAFQLHIVVHIVQFMVLRIYTPAILTSIISTLFFIVASYKCWHILTMAHVLLIAFLTFVIIVVHLLLAFKYALWFQKWLNKYEQPL